MNRCITTLTIFGILSLLILAACGGNSDAESSESGGEHSSKVSESSEHGEGSGESKNAQESGEADSTESGEEGIPAKAQNPANTAALREKGKSPARSMA